MLWILKVSLHDPCNYLRILTLKLHSMKLWEVDSVSELQLRIGFIVSGKLWRNSCSIKWLKFNVKCDNSLTPCIKIVRIRSYSGPHFPAFGLNVERYPVSLRIQSECGKMLTRITSNTDNFHAVTPIGSCIPYNKFSSVFNKFESSFLKSNVLLLILLPKEFHSLT